MQVDVLLIDNSGKRFLAHSGILKLHFPVFRGMKFKKNQVVIFDGANGSEVDLMLGLAYGRGRWGSK